MIDHAKFFMQVCVIAQHHLSSVLRSGGHTGPLLTAFILWENSFAMPLFAFFSGFTSKSDVTPARARKTLVNAWLMYYLNLLVPTVARGWWKTPGILPSPMVGFQSFHVPSWFMQSWISWKLLLPYVRHLSPRALLVASVAASWMGGYWTTKDDAGSELFSLRRTIALLPFFILGFVTPPSYLAAPSLRVKAAAAAVHLSLAGAIVGLSFATYDNCANSAISRYGRWVHSGYKESYLYGGSYGDDGSWSCACYDASKTDCVGCGSAEYHLHWTHRATAHALMLVLGASFVLLMPSRPTRFSAHGAHGLYAYMLQVPYLNFYVLPFKWGPCASTVALLKLEGAMLPLTLALSVVAAYVLTSAPVRKATCFMMDPTWANRLVGLARDTERKPFILSAIACALLYALPEAFELAYQTARGCD